VERDRVRGFLTSPAPKHVRRDSAHAIRPFGQVYCNELMAASLFATLPTFAVFLIFQRQLIQGVVASGLKG
jgi:ABC-type glycerol-3-phosphate transport system permease component